MTVVSFAIHAMMMEDRKYVLLLYAQFELCVGERTRGTIEKMRMVGMIGTRFWLVPDDIPATGIVHKLLSSIKIKAVYREQGGRIRATWRPPVPKT